MELNDHLVKVFEAAKQSELDGKEMYLKEMEKTDDPGLKRILQMLADAEQNHYEIFEGLQKDHDVEIKETSLDNITNIFKEIVKSGKSIVTSEEHADFYKTVQKMEEHAEREYLAEAEKTNDPKLKKIFQDLAAEERRHVILMHSFFNMCLNPEAWVENAEFNHFMDY